MKNAVDQVYALLVLKTENHRSSKSRFDSVSDMRPDGMTLRSCEAFFR
jgi:hypothetical protein